MDYRIGDTICIRFWGSGTREVLIVLSPEVVNFAVGYELVAQDGKVIADAAP